VHRPEPEPAACTPVQLAVQERSGRREPAGQEQRLPARHRPALPVPELEGPAEPLAELPAAQGHSALLGPAGQEQRLPARHRPAPPGPELEAHRRGPAAPLAELPAVERLAAGPAPRAGQPAAPERLAVAPVRLAVAPVRPAGRIAVVGQPVAAPAPQAGRIAAVERPAAGPAARRRVEPGPAPGRWKREEREPTKRAHAAWSPSAKAASPLRHPCEAAGASTIPEKRPGMPATRWRPAADRSPGSTG
jgi:hypothetical protein